jgi:hypothetical protein
MADRDPVHQFKRGIIEQISTAPGLADNSAVPVIGVLAGADIGYNNHRRDFCLDPADCLLHDAFRIIRRPGFWVLGLGDSKDQDSPHPFLPQIFYNRRDPTDRVPELPGHGIDRARLFQVLVNEKRGYQIVFRDLNFTQERLDIP